MVLMRGRSKPRRSPQLLQPGSLRLDCSNRNNPYVPPAVQRLVIEMTPIAECSQQEEKVADDGDSTKSRKELQETTNDNNPTTSRKELQETTDDKNPTTLQKELQETTDCKNPTTQQKQLQDITDAENSTPPPQKELQKTTFVDDKEEWCSLADESYRRSFLLACSKGTIRIVASHLSGQTMKDLKEFCSKKLNGVRFKLCLSDKFQQATICITPLVEDSDKRSVVLLQSFKTLRCALKGIPIVSPSWVTESTLAGDPLVPCGNLVARTLPCKMDTLYVDHSSCGIAKIVAKSKEQDSFLMSGYQIVFGHEVSAEVKSDMEALALEAGAVVLKRNATRNTLARLSSTLSNGSIVLVGNAPTGPGSIDDSIKIVDPTWVFDFVSCGRDPSHIHS